MAARGETPTSATEGAKAEGAESATSMSLPRSSSNVSAPAIAVEAPSPSYRGDTESPQTSFSVKRLAGQGISVVGHGIGAVGKGVGSVGKGVGTVGKGVGSVGVAVGSSVGHGVRHVGRGIGVAGKFAVSTAAVPFQRTSAFVTSIANDTSLFPETKGSQAQAQEDASSDPLALGSGSESEDEVDDDDLPRLSAPAQTPDDEATPHVSRRTLSIKQSPEEFTLYVLALRCFLNPFEDDAAVAEADDNWASKLTFGLTDQLEDLIVDKSAQLSLGQVRRLMRHVRDFIERLGREADPDELFMKSLRKFVDRLAFQAPELVSKGKATRSGLISLYREILRIEMSRKEGGVVDEKLFSERIARFEKLVGRDLEDRSKNANSNRRRVSLFGNAQAGRETRSTIHSIASKDKYLARVFDVGEDEHARIKQTEEFVQTKEVIIDELKSRLKSLDAHPFYNKETFVQKTAAFLKWKASQEEAIHKMLAVLGADKPEQSEEFVPPPSESGDAVPVEFIVTVCKARDLTGKDKTGFSDPYVTIEHGGEAMRTSTCKQTLNPSWFERCKFAIKPDTKTFEVKFAVWDEDEPSEKLFSMKMLNLFDNKDDFLGQVTVTVNLSDMLRYPVERWYKLEKRHKRSHISGEILLKFEVVTKGGSKDKAQQPTFARVQRSNTNPQSIAQAAKDAKNPDYHHLYRVLVERCFAYEYSLFQARLQREGGAGKKRMYFRPSQTLFMLLQEFGLRYCVGNLYRVLVATEIAAQSYAKDELDIVSLSYLLVQLKERIQHPDSRWTRAEQTILCDSFDVLEDAMMRRISMFTDHFPFSSPPGHLRQTIRALCLIYDNPTYRERKTHAKDLERVLRACIVTCCGALYARFSAMAAPVVRPSNKAAASAESISAELDMIMREIDNVAVYFRTDFVVFDGSRMIQLDPVAECVAGFGRLLAAEVEGELAVTFSDRFHPEVFTLYHRLRRYNERNLILARGSGFQGFPLADMFRPHVDSWLAQTRVKGLEWVKAAIESDKFAPLSDKERHSSSVVDLFCMLHQFADFLLELKWPNEEQGDQFFTSLSETVAMIIDYFGASMVESLNTIAAKGSTSPSTSPQLTRRTSASNMSVEATSTIGRFFSGQGKTPSQVPFAADICVRLNNLEAARQQLGELYSRIDADAIAARWNSANAPIPATETPASDTPVGDADAASVTNNSSSRAMLPSTSNASLLDGMAPISRHFQSAADSIREHMTGLESRLLAQVRPAVMKAIDGVTTEEPMAIVRFFSRRKASADFTPSLGEVNAALGPAMDIVSGILDEYSKLLYGDLFDTLLATAWDAAVECIGDAVSTKRFESGHSFEMLNQVLVTLWDFFHADGSGLAPEALNTEIYKVVLEMTNIMRSRQYDALLALYSLHERHPRCARLLRDAMNISDDKACREFVAQMRRPSIPSLASVKRALSLASMEIRQRANTYA